jgi:hypothetical protein
MFDFEREKTGHKDVPPLTFVSSGPVAQNMEDSAPVLHIELDTYCLPIYNDIRPLGELYNDSDYIQKLDSGKMPIPMYEEKKIIEKILAAEPLVTHSYTRELRAYIWKYREYITLKCETFNKTALSKVLQSCNWGSRAEVKEMHKLLLAWKQLSPMNALQLLGSRFSDPIVRLYAVQSIATMPDHVLCEFLLQLVQALKLESYHDSPLARFLIKRAISNPSRIGHTLFWLLHSEMHDQHVCERFSVILELYLRNCGSHRQSLKKQYRVNELLKNVTAQACRIKEKSLRSQFARNQLNRVVSHFPVSFELCLSSRLACRRIVVEECKVMDSKMAPLWVSFENLDPDGEKILVIFKAGDDLRQDLMTLQMIRIMDQIWMEDGLDLRLKPYGCTGTGNEVGMIEIVKNADTTARIMGKSYGIRGAFALSPIDDWLKESSSCPYEQCVDNFIRSCAGYCVATYLMGIGDRHPSNIMVTRAGHLFHIDFGHFLGNFKSKMGIKRERAPFVFTPQMLQVMGGLNDEKFVQFLHFCCDGLNMLRKHGHLFMVLFQLMIPAGMPELRSNSDIEYLSQMLMLELKNEDAETSFQKEVRNSLNTASRQIDNFMHLVAHQ